LLKSSVLVFGSYQSMRFVSGYRFSDTINSRKHAPLGAGARISTIQQTIWQLRELPLSE
jgi:hypothetical protein